MRKITAMILVLCLCFTCTASAEVSLVSVGESNVTLDFGNGEDASARAIVAKTTDKEASYAISDNIAPAGSEGEQTFTFPGMSFNAQDKLNFFLWEADENGALTMRPLTSVFKHEKGEIWVSDNQINNRQGSVAYHSFDALRQSYTVSFNLTVVSTGDLAILLGDSSNGSLVYGTSSSTLLFNGANFTVRNGNGNGGYTDNGTTLCAVKTGEAYRVEISGDVSSNTYTVSITDSAGTTYKSNAITARTNASKLDTIALISNGVNTTVNSDGSYSGYRFYIDSFSITSSDSFAAAFNLSRFAKVTVYYTQDKNGEKLENATTAYARNGDTGEIDMSGNGQINFEVTAAKGYEVDTVTIEPDNYGKLMSPEETGSTYRITNVTGDITVTITTKEAEDGFGSAFTDIFGWNFTTQSEFAEPSVVSWNNYRGVFLLFKMPSGITEEFLDTNRVTAKLTLTMTPNNANQNFTATVFGVSPEAVINGSLFTDGGSQFSAAEINTQLTDALKEKEILGLMQVTAADNTKSYSITSKTLELTSYIREHLGDKYIALYISNRAEDGCDSYGMAHYDGVEIPSLDIKTEEYDWSVPQKPDVSASGLREITTPPEWINEVPYADPDNEYADFYTKAVYVYGLPICSTDDVPDEALFKAYDVIEVCLRKMYYNYPEIIERMIAHKVNIIIVGEHEFNYQHPSWRYWEDKTERRGGGGINTTVLVEDLIVPGSDTWRQTFAGLVHEFTHTTLTYGIGDVYGAGARSDIYEKINAAYEKAAAANMYPSPNEYDVSNYHEYFSGQVGRWFNGSPTDLPVANANTLTDREQLEIYDPDVYEICKMLYAPLELPTPWGSGINSLSDEEGVKYVMENDYFKVAIGKYGQISSLKIADDTSADFRDTDYMLNESNAPQQGADEKEHHWFGELLVNARTSGGKWVSSDTSTSEDRKIIRSTDGIYVLYNGGEIGSGVQNVQLAEEYKLNGDTLEWSISITNPSASELEVGDLGISMPFNEYWTPAYTGEELYDTRVLAHSFVGRNSSYIYATRPSGQGKMLLLTPDPETGAGLEYRDNWRNNNGHNGSLWAQDNGGWSGGLNVYYIHSNVIKSTGSGYIGSTSLMLAPGETKTYTFRFKSVADEAELRTELYDQGIVDAVAVPGFAYAKDMPAKFYLHVNDDVDIKSVDIECVHKSGLYSGLSNSVNNNLPHEDGAKAVFSETKTIDKERYMIYDLELACLGANHVVVNYTYKGEELSTTLQFYLMDSVSDALELHSDFLVEKTQINTPGKTGDKVFDDWMMDSKTTRSETMNGYWQMSYWGWGDDWGLTHGTFLAQKNVYIPVKSQVEALDEYLDTAIWNGLMGEHQDDYLIHDFLSDEPNESPTYRGYAYPHIYNTYFAMYRIADKYPNLTEYKESKETYLLRAYNILHALYHGPVAYNWATGLMGEITTPDIIDALEKEGYHDEAEDVKSIMSRKYDNFKNTKYPYGSEYSYDNTGEEAVYTLAKLNDNTEMMQKIDWKTRACRGLQPVWYYYGVPTTICGENWWNFQYTAALAGYCMDDWLRIQDNGKTSSEISDAERVNYAAKLANLTCINSGQIDSDPANIGASAWTYQAFLGHSGGQGTGGGMLHNGWRQMSGESDLGLFGAMEILSADIATDNIFGLFGYGCEVEEVNGKYNVTPLDGVATRLNLINEKIYIELERDRYNSASVSKNGSLIRLTLENLEGTAHSTEITVTGLPVGNYRLTADGKEVGIIKADGETVFTVPVSVNGTCSVEISAVN